MPLLPTPNVWPFVAAGVLNVALAALSWRRRSLLTARFLFALAVGAAVWAGSAALTHYANSPSVKVFLTHARYLPIAVMPVLWLLFSSAYAGYGRRIKVEYAAFLLIVPLFTVLATATNDLHHLMFTDTRVVLDGPVATVAHDYGAWFWIHTVYSYLLVGAGVVLIGLKVGRASPLFRGQASVMSAGALAPIAANALYLYSPSSLAYVDPTPVAFALSTLFFGIGVLRFHLFDILPVARSEVLDHVTEGFVVLDYEGRILELNGAASHFLHLGNHGSGRLAYDVPGPLAASWSQAVSNGVGTGSEEYAGRWLEWSIRAIEAGRVGNGVLGRGWLFLVRDVTAHHETERRLAEARDHAEELSALKSAFLSNLHHELRTPLAGIIGLSDVMETEVDGDAVEFVRMIRVSGERLMDTLDSLLAVAELDAGRVVPDLDRIDVVSETMVAVSKMRAEAQQKGLLLETRSDYEACSATADSRHFAEIMRHLLGNAVKYTDKGGITVSVTDLDHEVMVAVSDTGCGMDKEFVPKAFESFRQADSDLTRAFGGTGLGLRVARGLAERMGARVEVESEPGIGSSFYLLMPAWKEGPEVDPSAPQGLDPTEAADRNPWVQDASDRGVDRVSHLVSGRAPDNAPERAPECAPDRSARRIRGSSRIRIRRPDRGLRRRG